MTSGVGSDRSDRGGLSVSLHRHGQVVVADVVGELYLPQSHRLVAALCAAVEESPGRAVVCDLSGLAAPQSTHLLSAFPTALRRSGMWPASTISLAAADPDLQDTLRRYRMERYLPVHRFLDDAIEDAAGEAEARRTRLRVAPDPSRLHGLRAALDRQWPWPKGAGLQAATLVLQELAANAIKHVGLPFEVVLMTSRRRVLLAVTDQGRAEPVVRPHRGDSAIDGRGMQVVSQLSKAWGVRLVPPHAKTVWADCGEPRAVPGEARALPREPGVVPRQSRDAS